MRPLLGVALDALGRGATDRAGATPGGSERVAAELAAAYADELLPEHGAGPTRALGAMARAFAAGAADPADPRCAAHLHCPPLALAAAADLVTSALNPSLDSWDQGPSGVALEPEVVRVLSGLVGYEPDSAAGTITSGGTESNLTALLLARDHTLRAACEADVAREGLPEGARPRLLCSEVAHFSVTRTAGYLGLGEDAVIPVAAGAAHRMDPDILDAKLASCRAGGETPVAVVATAGTTDVGAVDPLADIAEVAGRHGVWLHVDASYGGGVLFSTRLAGLLDGIRHADSVALDLHKLGWQPVAAGVLLTRDQEAFAPLARQVAYLNPDDDEEAGYPSLLGRSLRTTRRPDAFKIAVTLRAYGRSGLGALVDRCHDLAREAARRIAAHPRLELYAEPVLTTVVFRYVPRAGAPDRVNATLRRVLLAEGRAVVGRTEAGGAVRLKLTLLNPSATDTDVERLLADVVAAGDKEDR